MADKEQTLRDLIENIRFAMFTTRSREGMLRSRPMTAQNADADDPDASQRLWFFMSRSTDPVRDISFDPKVNVAFAHPGEDAYISVSGTAQVINDLAIKRQLWSKMTEAWFPKGVEDPDLALVRVEIDEAEYWKIKENKLMQMARMAKAAMTGKRPTNLGEHAQVRNR
jgi:general stress protein 26